MLSTAVESS